MGTNYILLGKILEVVSLSMKIWKTEYTEYIDFDR